MKNLFKSIVHRASCIVHQSKTLTLLTLLLSVNMAWGEAKSVELCTSWNKTLAYTTEYTQDYTINNLNGGTVKMTLGVKGVYRQSNANTYFQMNKKDGYFKNTTKLPGKITKIETTWSAAKGATKCYFATDAAASSSNKTVTVTAATSVTYTPPTDADYYFFNIDPSTGSGSAQMTSCVVYYESAAPSNPYTVTFDAGSNGTLSCPSCTEGNKLKEASAGAGVTLPSCTPSSDDYVFDGWATTQAKANAGDADAGAANETYKPSENCTLYAVYKYNVKWSVNGAIKETVAYKAGANLSLPTVTPTTSDCDEVKVFVGWSADPITSATDTPPSDLFTAASGTVTAPKTYYAVFADASGSSVEETYTFASFTSAKSVTFNSTNYDVVLNVGSGSTNPAWSSNEARLYAKGYCKISSKNTISKIVYNYAINENKSHVVPTIDGAEGKTNVGSWDAANKTWTGSDTEVTLSTSGSAGNLGFTSVTVTLGSATYSNYTTTCGAAKELDHISVSGTPETFWVGDEFNHDGITVTAHYTDESSSTVSSWTTDFDGKTFAATDVADGKTVTVSYQGKNATYTIDVKTIANTAETAYTVAQAKTLIDAGKDLATQVYVTGTVSKIVTAFDSNYGNISFNVSADGETTGDQFQFYRNFKGASKTKWTTSDLIPEVADEVIGFGTLKKHSSTYEFDEGNYIVSLTRPKKLTSITVSGTPAYFDTQSAFNHDGMTVTAHYNTGASDDADVTASAVFTAPDMTTPGEKTVNVSYTENEIKKETSYKIQVAQYCAKVVTITKGDEENGTFSLSQTGNICADGGLTISVTDIVPAKHYHFKEITTTNGTVNDKTVTGITDDAIITVVFEEDTKYDVKWMVSGEQMGETQSLYEGDDVTAPTNEVAVPAACANEGKVFVGWTADENVDPETAPAFFTPHKMGAANETYYAVFATKGGTPITWTKMAASEISESGTYALITSSGNAFTGSISSGRGAYTTGTFSFTNNVASTAPDGTLELELTAYEDEGDYLFDIYNSTYGYLYIKAASEGNLAWSKNALSEKDFWIYDKTDENFEFWHNIENNPYFASLRVNSGTFRTYTYTSTTGSIIAFAKKNGGVTYSDYVTSCVIPTYSVTIQSNNTTMGSVTVEPEITEDAYAAGTEFYVEATAEEGYRFVNWTISDNNEGASLSEGATAAVNMFTTGAADVTLTANFEAIPADPLTVTLKVGEHGTLDCEDCVNNTITEKTAGDGVLVPDVTANEGWAFLGWSTSSTATVAEYNPADADIFYPSDDNKTLYAVYAQLYKVTLKYTDEVRWQETVGGAITLPIDRNCKNETYKDHFAGWSETEFAEETVNPTETPTIYAESITPTEDVILYPIFSVTTEGTQWVKQSITQVTEGVYALITPDGHAFNGSISQGKGGITTNVFTFDANNIATSVPTGICEITMEPVVKSEKVVGYTMFNASKGYLYAKAAKSGNLAWHDTEDADWCIYNDNWEYYKKYDNKYAYLRTYNNATFNTYGSTSDGDAVLQFAKKETVSAGKYWSKPANDVTNPELDLAAGDYLAPQTVKITAATYQSDYKYYYTTNGNEPDKTSTEYNHDAGIVLNAAAEAQKVQVIGYDEDGYASQIAAAEYTIWATYSTLAEMYDGFQKDKLVGLSMTDAYIHKVNKTSGANPTTQLFLQEKNSTLGVVISMPIANVPEAITSEIEGKSITFTVAGKYALGNGRKQIGGATIADGFTISDNTVTRPTAEVKTVWDADLASTNLLGLIKLENVYVISENGTTIIVNTQADGQGTAYTIYDIFYAVGKVPESTLLCNVSGLFNVRDDVYSIMPVITEDFSLVTPTNATLPTLNIYGGSQAEPVKVGLNEVINITPADGFTAYYKVNDATDWTKITKQVEPITLTADAKLEVKSSRDYYTDATAAYYYEVDASLTKYAITIPSLSKTRGTVTVTLNAEEVASAKAGETLTITVSDITEHFHINSVSVVKSEDNKQTAAEVVSVSEGVYTFVMPECNVDIKVTYGEEKKYSIEYQKGKIQAEGEDITEVAQYQGTVLTLKECTWTSDNYIFKGWKAQYNDGEKDVELPITNNTITVPAYDVKIIAQWNKIASYDWVLVTDASTLKAGDYVVIASNAKGKVASNTISSNVMGEIGATFTDDYGYLKSVPTGTAVLTLGGTASAWTLSDKDGHKLGATAEKKVAWDGQNATNTWTISVDANTYAATIQNTHKTNNSYDYGRFLHNVNSTRFTTYTSAANNTMLLPQLYKAVEHTFVVKYNLNGGANKPADSHADADGKVTITTDVPTNTGNKFMGWTENQDGSGQEYVGGQEYTIEDDITVYAQWQEVSKYKITFEKGADGVKGTLPTRADQYEAAQITMPGQNSLVYEDHIFRGWSDGEKTYQENDKYTMPNHDVIFTAQWESLFDTHWALVVSLEQLQDGDKVIIAAANAEKALGAESDNNQYRHQVDVKKSADKFYLSALQTAPTELTLGIVDGKYTFNDGDGYLAAASSSSNYLNIKNEVSDASTWNVTITDGVASVVALDESLHNVMSYNSQNPRFSCYTGVQGALAIYKYYEDKPTYYTRENMTAGKIGTICMENNILAAANATIYMPDYKDANIKNVYFIEATEELAIPGMPFIFQAEQDGRMILVLGSETVDAPVSDLGQTRGMVGSFDDNVPVVPFAEEGPHNYFFSSNKLWKVGEEVYVDKNRAYLNMDYVQFEDGKVQDDPSSAPRRHLSLMNANATDMPTGFNYIFGKPAEAIQKLIINNQLIIIRHGHFYNAAGALMK